MQASLHRYIAENTQHIQDQNEYNRRYEEMRMACEEVEKKIEAVNKDILAQLGRKEQIRRCLNELRQHGDILEEFDLDLWNTMVESACVSKDGTLTVRFRDGTEIPVQVPKKK